MPERAEEEHDFDWDAEIDDLLMRGFVLPLPIVQRIMDVYELVRAVGWSGARRLCHATFRGWEVEALASGCAMLGAADRGREQLEQHRFLARLIGGARG